MGDKWIFNHAIHRGTITSRDVAQPTKHETEEGAIKEYQQQRDFYHSIGYKIWWAKITAPDGTISTLEVNPYQR